MSMPRFTSPEVDAYDAACREMRERGTAAGAFAAGIAYGPDPAHRLDVYRPRVEGRLPVVLAFHGGGFSQGDQMWSAPFAPLVVGLPAILVSATYRRMRDLADRGPFEDGLRALAFVRAEIAGPEDPVFLAGHSAGAALAATIALDPGLPGPPPAGVVAISASFNRFALTGTPGGGYELPPGELPVTPDAPLALVDHAAAVPPWFIAWGGRERQRGRIERSSLAFAGKLAMRGASVEIRFDPEADHFETHLLFGRGQHPWIGDVQAWLRARSGI